MNCPLCEDSIKTNDAGKMVGRFTTIKSWGKPNDDGEFNNVSYRSLNAHKVCALRLLEANGVSLAELV